MAVILPGLSLEDAGPVVRGQELAGARALAGPPVIIIVVGIVLALAALDEPGVLVRGVVDHQIHEHAHPALVCLLEHAPEHMQVAVIRVYVHIVRDVIAPVRVGRGVERGEPDRVHAETFEIVQPVQHAVQVADAVAVAVAEAAGPDMIHDQILVPGGKSHETPSKRSRILLLILAQSQALANKARQVFRQSSRPKFGHIDRTKTRPVVDKERDLCHYHARERVFPRAERRLRLRLRGKGQNI